MKIIKNILILLLFLPVLFNACKDNPVTVKPPITIDSTDIYDWKVITYGGYLRGLFVADSNNVFLNGTYYKPLLYNGQTIEEIELNDPEFEFILVGGYDKNNVIFGGGQIPYKDPVIKKWTNGSITTYTILNDSGTSVHDILMEGPNQAWISTTGKNKIYYFNSGQFTRYFLDDSVRYTNFFKDAYGQLYAFGIVRRTPAPSLLDILYTYKRMNDGFHLITKDSLYPSTPKTHYIMKCGTDMFMVAAPDWFDQIYRFNGNNWEYYNTVPEHNKISNVGGISKDYFLMFSGDRLVIYIWNGNWRKEDSLKFPAYPPFFSIGSSSIVIKNEDVYFTTGSYTSLPNFLIIGKKKK